MLSPERTCFRFVTLILVSVTATPRQVPGQPGQAPVGTVSSPARGQGATVEPAKAAKKSKYFYVFMC